MLARHARLILADVYATRERGDLDTTLSYCTSHIAYAVHASRDAPSFIGSGVGRDALAFQLERFARQFAVEEFRLQLLRTEGILLVSTVAFRYRPRTVHRVTALEDTLILEVSTPHLDDVVRLEDRYGRAGAGQP